MSGGSFLPCLAHYKNQKMNLLPQSQDFDLIVSGFGCAGMSVLFYLLQSDLKKSKILVIDSSKKIENDRTWCYWAKTPLDIHPKRSPIVSWKQIQISNGEERITKSTSPLSYFHIRSIDFYREIRELAFNHPNVSFVTDSVLNIQNRPDGKVQVNTLKNGSFNGGKVLNSIFLPQFGSIQKPILYQHFVGWEIETDKDCFDQDTAILMDFLPYKKGPVDFIYILPFGKRRALLEYTAFSNDHINSETMEEKIKTFIRDSLQNPGIEIKFKENGRIPMTTFAMSRGVRENIIMLGTLAGCTKPSTGYTFYNIQRHSQEVVRQLVKGDVANRFAWTKKKRYDFYDNIFLNIAKRWPEKLPQVFVNLFAVNSAPNVFHFLNEETSLWEEIKILGKLKFQVFLKSLYNYERH
jgi:lycopene beta-cyclase